MTGTRGLSAAKRAKKDEFYTQLADIAEEVRHYAEHFRGKVVLCNCDDPRVSNFFHYFSHNFERLGLKRLVATCYKSQDRDLFSQNACERAIWLEYAGDRNGNRVPDPEEIGIHALRGDGDFRSAECVELLKTVDVVVTNPPFSLFREYVAQLVRHGKKFLVIGNVNALTYKEIFPLAHDYLAGVCNRQDYLETAIRWISKGDIEGYMAKRQRDPNAAALWIYFQSVISWAKAVFPRYRREMKGVAWGELYDKYHANACDAEEMERRVKALMEDSDVTKKSGIYAYVFDGDERHLQLRAFDGNTRREVYERQKGVCAICGKRFAFEEMEADHVTPWAEGGRTVTANCQMLCRTCNRRKSDK